MALPGMSVDMSVGMSDGWMAQNRQQHAILANHGGQHGGRPVTQVAQLAHPPHPRSMSSITRDFNQAVKGLEGQGQRNRRTSPAHMNVSNNSISNNSISNNSISNTELANGSIDATDFSHASSGSINATDFSHATNASIISSAYAQAKQQQEFEQQGRGDPMLSVVERRRAEIGKQSRRASMQARRR